MRFKLEFKPEHFDGCGLVPSDSGLISDVANARLREMLEEAPVVVACKGGIIETSWVEQGREFGYKPTLRARLVEIEGLGGGVKGDI